MDVYEMVVVFIVTVVWGRIKLSGFKMGKFYTRQRGKLYVVIKIKLKW